MAVLASPRRPRPADEAGRAHERDLSVAAAVAKRSLRHAFTNPSLLLPSLLFPLVFLLAFAGGLSSIDKVPGFEYPPGYTAFQYVFVVLQSAAFGGVFTGFGIAARLRVGLRPAAAARRARAPGDPARLRLSAMVRFLFTVFWSRSPRSSAGMPSRARASTWPAC